MLIKAIIVAQKEVVAIVVIFAPFAGIAPY